MITRTIVDLEADAETDAEMLERLLDEAVPIAAITPGSSVCGGLGFDRALTDAEDACIMAYYQRRDAPEPEVTPRTVVCAIGGVVITFTGGGAGVAIRAKGSKDVALRMSAGIPDFDIQLSRKEAVESAENLLRLRAALLDALGLPERDGEGGGHGGAGTAGAAEDACTPTP